MEDGPTKPSPGAGERPAPAGEPARETADDQTLVQLAMRKLSSQALIFGLAVVVIVVGAAQVVQVEGWLIILAVLVVSGLALFGYLFAEQKRRVRAGDPGAVSGLVRAAASGISHPAPPAAAATTAGGGLRVRVWTSSQTGGARDIAVAAGDAAGTARPAAYRIGDRIVVHVEVSADCHLTLLNVGTSGAVTVLFPNAHHPGSRLARGQHAIPGPGYGFHLPLMGPPGSEVIKAIATREPLAAAAAWQAAGGAPFATRSAAQGARDIAVVKDEVAALPPPAWAESEHRFTVAG